MHTEPKPSNPEIQYEKTDASVRPLYQFLFWITVITILVTLMAWGILKALESWRDQDSVRPVMAQPHDQLPPAPRLQTRETLDLAAFRKSEDEVLSTYGVVDKEKGIYRIPIEEAMRLTAERGLPATASAGEPVAAASEPAEGSNP